MRAISVTLERDNLVWLKGKARAERRRSVSEELDRLIAQARGRGKAIAPSRSIVGSVSIDPADPGLLGADDAVRALFAASLEPVPARVSPRGRPPRTSRGAQPDLDSLG